MMGFSIFKVFGMGSVIPKEIKNIICSMIKSYPV